MSQKTKDSLMLVGRILIGLLFIYMGYEKFTNMPGTISFMQTTGVPMAGVLAWVAAIIESVGGLMLILGVHAECAAMVLSLFLVIVTFTFHRDITDPMQITQLTKNLAIIGGLLQIVTNCGGGYVLMKCKCCK